MKYIQNCHSSFLENTPLVNYEKIIDYYHEADEEYAGWSENLNMHFGYFKLGDNPFDLEKMLSNLNYRVYQKLDLAPENSNHLLDMGCGLGATARQFSEYTSIDAVTGITVVAPQVFEAKRLQNNLNHDCTLTFALQDYHCTQFDDNTFEGAYAIESACHSAEEDKASLIKEAYRILKPGGRFVISDGFTIGKRPLNSILKYCYDKVCDGWALGNFPEINQVEQQMKVAGFKDIQIEDASWNIAPSVAFIPFVAIKYFFKRLFQSNSKQKWDHLFAPVFLLPLALSKKRFGYFIVSGKK